MSVRLEAGDCLEVIPRLVAEGVVCDSCACDPPYHLTATQKRFGAANSAPAQYGKDGAMSRLSGGFMGQKWDGGDIAFRSETWATVATILRPGAFLIAFGGTRTYHRLVTAIEDAGFVIQDQVAWLFGSGFPKRRDMLKPAFEPIVLAYKPGGKRTMQVDECRIATGAIDDYGRSTTKADGSQSISRTSEFDLGAKPYSPGDRGRWPANVCLSDDEEVTEAFAAFGERKVGSGTVIRESGRDRNGNTSAVYGAESRAAGTPTPNYGDTGSAARFFFCAKADSQDRWGSRHPTVKPVELMKWLVPLVTPPGGLVLDPFAGSGTTGVAALATGRDCILIEREEQYLADIRERLAFYDGGGTHSVQAKNRSRKQEAGPLFAEPYDPVADGIGSHNAAISEIGRRVKSGEEDIPTSGYFAGRTSGAAE